MRRKPYWKVRQKRRKEKKCAFRPGPAGELISKAYLTNPTLVAGMLGVFFYSLVLEFAVPEGMLPYTRIYLGVLGDIKVLTCRKKTCVGYRKKFQKPVTLEMDSLVAWWVNVDLGGLVFCLNGSRVAS